MYIWEKLCYDIIIIENEIAHTKGTLMASAYDRDIVAAHEAGHFAVLARYGGRGIIKTMKIRAGAREGGYIKHRLNGLSESVRAISHLAGAVWAVMAGCEWDHNDFKLACSGDLSKWYERKFILMEDKFEAMERAVARATPAEHEAADCVILGLGLSDDVVTRGALVTAARLYRSKRAFREHVVRETRRGRQQWGQNLTDEMYCLYFEK